MANITVTNTFSNSTTADATQVNTNFTDIINGTSDGTKDFSISALTCAGAATLNGAVTLGNATGDDITFTGSLASSIPIKTTTSYNIGTSTIGLTSIYFGDAGSAARCTRVIGGTIAAGITLTLPITDGDNRDFIQSDGSGVLSFVPIRRSASDAQNLGLAATVAASALTIALKGADGNDASATNPVDIAFRSATAATGTVTTRTVTAALTVVVSSGSTLGSTDADANWVHVYAIDNAGTVELAVAGTRFVDEGSVVTTTAEGGAGAADSKYVLYSTTARTGVAVRYLGRVKSTQATAGTWATSPSEISCGPIEQRQFTSEIWLYSANGYGSGNTKVRRWTTVARNLGSAMTLTQSAANGDMVTINEDGMYSVSYSDQFNASNAFGITRNSTQGTTSINGTTRANIIASAQTPGASVGSLVQVTLFLMAGDFLWAHTEGSASGTQTYNEDFHISKVT